MKQADAREIPARELASASRPRRPALSISVEPARPSTTGSPPATRPAATLILRIEDTDRERSTAENVDQILDAMEWLGLTYDEGPISQAGRADRHAAALAQLLESGAAYRDAATAKDVEAWKAEHGAGRGYRGTPTDEPGAAVRLRVPDEGETIVEDLIHGPVAFPNVSYDDFVIARGDESVLYNFAVAVDDAEMGVTEVVRGDDHLSNTPKQLLVLRGARPPAAALRPPAAAPRPRRQEALQAPRRRLGAGAARCRLPARRGPQLPGAARLGHRRRHHADVDRGADPPLRGRRRRQVGGDLRREEAALAERSLHARDAARRIHAGGRPPPRPRARRAAPRSLRDHPGESADPGGGLAADPLPLRAAGRGREGLDAR